MSVELIAILAVGGALAGVILTATRELRQAISVPYSQFRADFRS